MCHRSHTAHNRNLLKLSEPQSNLCFTCHDGSQAIDIKSQFSDPNVPPNVPDTSTFYSHPATTASAHTQAAIDEFKNVLNRHTECGDCHNPHRGNKSRVAATAKGYTVSGAELLITGVRAKQSRALVWRRASKYEYELCYKCHSSYTILLSYSKPSRQMTDVAADFDPANPSHRERGQEHQYNDCE
jgi:predicted CXXCH cytochrome family protein